MATPLQTVTQSRRVQGKSYLTLSCGHATATSKVLAVGERFQCRASECHDAARQASMDAMYLAARISGQLELRLKRPQIARNPAYVLPTAELQALTVALHETLTQLAAAEQSAQGEQR